LLPVRVVAEC